MIKDLIKNKKVAYFHGCFHNYYYPEVGEAVVDVLKKNGIEVHVPEQVCCALPMMAKGNVSGAHKNMEYNNSRLADLVREGCMVVGSCSSCVLMIKRDYKLLLGTADAELVSDNTYQITEYLLKLKEAGLLNTNFRTVDQSVFYFTPCHMRNQEIGRPSADMLNLIPGTKVEHISDECCGMSGAYGYEKKNFALSKDIATKILSDISEFPTDKIVTDCGGCKLQLEAGTGKTVHHPMILLDEAYAQA